MIEIAGKPILQHNVELLVAAGIKEIIINVHHHAETIVNAFGDGRAFGAKIRYAFEATLLGTAGAARNVSDWLQGKEFIVVYGDNLSTIDLKKMLVVHHRHDADLTMALFHRDDTESSGVVAIAPDGRITEFQEKPKKGDEVSNLVNAGYYVASPRVLAAIPSAGPADFGRDVFPWMLKHGARLFGYKMTERLWWFDTVADYERVSREFANGE